MWPLVLWGEPLPLLRCWLSAYHTGRLAWWMKPLAPPGGKWLVSSGTTQGLPLSKVALPWRLRVPLAPAVSFLIRLRCFAPGAFLLGRGSWRLRAFCFLPSTLLRASPLGVVCCVAITPLMAAYGGREVIPQLVAVLANDVFSPLLPLVAAGW